MQNSVGCIATQAKSALAVRVAELALAFQPLTDKDERRRPQLRISLLIKPELSRLRNARKLLVGYPERQDGQRRWARGGSIANGY